MKNLVFQQLFLLLDVLPRLVELVPFFFDCFVFYGKLGGDFDEFLSQESVDFGLVFKFFFDQIAFAFQSSFLNFMFKKCALLLIFSNESSFLTHLQSLHMTIELRNDIFQLFNGCCLLFFRVLVEFLELAHHFETKLKEYIHSFTYKR